MTTKIFLALLIFLATSSNAISQSCGDTATCISYRVLQVSHYLIERGKIDSARVRLLSQKVDTLQNIVNDQSRRLSLKDSTIDSFRALELNYKSTEANFKQDIARCDQQYQAERKISDDLLKKFKGQRRKTIVVAAGGILAGIFIGHLVYK